MAPEVHVAADAASREFLRGPLEGTTVVRELETKKPWESSTARAVFDEWRGSVGRREAVEAACVFLETERCSVVERRAFRAWSVQSLARTWAAATSVDQETNTSPAAKRMDAHPGRVPLQPASQKSREVASGIALVASPRRGALPESPRRIREPRAPAAWQSPRASHNAGSSASILTEAEKLLLAQFRDASVSASGRESGTPTRARGRAGTSQDRGTPKAGARRDGMGAARSRSHDPRGWSSAAWGEALPDARALYERALRAPLKPPRPPTSRAIPPAVAGIPSGGEPSALEGAAEAVDRRGGGGGVGEELRAGGDAGGARTLGGDAGGANGGVHHGAGTAPAAEGPADALEDSDSQILDAARGAGGGGQQDAAGSKGGGADASLRFGRGGVEEEGGVEEAQVSGVGATGREGRRQAHGAGEVQGGGEAVATPARVRRGRAFVKAGRASSMERRIEGELAALTVQLRDGPRRARASPRFETKKADLEESTQTSMVRRDVPRPPLDAPVAATRASHNTAAESRTDTRASHGTAESRAALGGGAAPSISRLPSSDSLLAPAVGEARSEMPAGRGRLGGRAVARTLRLSRTEAQP